MINILEIKFDIEGNIIQDFTDRDVPQFSHNVQKIRMYIPKEIFSDISMVNIHFENDDEIVMIDAVANLYDTTLDYRIYDFDLTNYYTQYIGKLRLQASVNNSGVNVWTSFLYYVNVRKGVRGQSVRIDDPDIAVQLQGEIDNLQLKKQDIASVDLGNALDDIQDIYELYNYFYVKKDNKTRSYYVRGINTNLLTETLELDSLITLDMKWCLNFILLNSDGVFRILILFRDENGTINYGTELNSFENKNLINIGWIDLTYLHILKERDIEHDKAIKDLQADLSYNNIGLLWVSKYDEETGNITYVLNPDFNYLIDDSRLEETGEIDWYVRPKGGNA